MAHLLLTSDGICGRRGPEIRNQIELLLMPKKLLNTARVLYIDTAQRCYSSAYRWLVKATLGNPVKCLRSTGAAVDILDLASSTKEEAEKRISESDVLYIDGGSVYYLLDKARAVGLAEIVQSQANLVVVGCSAGSMIWGRSVGIADFSSFPGEERRRFNQSDTGFGILPASVWPHYDDPLRNWFLQRNLAGKSVTFPNIMRLRDGDFRVIRDSQLSPIS